MRLLPVAGLMMLASAVAARAGDDPIDTKLKACLASKDGQSTTGMVDCTGAAITAYDAKLNEVYQKALAALNPVSRDKLRASQRLWLQFRKADGEVYEGTWRQDRGTIIRIEEASSTLDAIKERVAELQVFAGED